MISPYLEKPLRAYEEVTALRDGQPDLKFFGDGLQQALHNHICMASFIRQQVKLVVASAKRRRKRPWSSWKIPDNQYAEDEEYDLDWLRNARKAHSKAILDREAYKQAINERDIQRELFRGEEE